DRWPGEDQEVVVVLEVAVPVPEPLAPVVPLLEVVGLDHRAYRAVEHQDPLAQRCGELLCAIGGGFWHVNDYIPVPLGLLTAAERPAEGSARGRAAGCRVLACAGGTGTGAWAATASTRTSPGAGPSGTGSTAAGSAARAVAHGRGRGRRRGRRWGRSRSR